MRNYKIGILSGDGIGLEIVPVTVEIIQAAADKVAPGLIDWRPLPIGFAAIEKYGIPMPQETLDELKKTDGWILGPDAGNEYPKHIKVEGHPGAGLRHAFQLYANIRPSKNLPNVASVAKKIDLVIVRENLEGLYPYGNMYSGVGEFMPTKDVALTIGKFSRPSIERISHRAFQMARKRRKKVTIIHKANVLVVSSGLFRSVAYEIAQQYPDVEVNDFMVDAAAAALVRRPEQFDVLVTENMFGDILSDLCGELAGALGVSPAINAADDYAMAQAAHGSAPDIAGKGIANPVGMIRSGAMLMDWLGDKHGDERMNKVARLVEAGLLAALEAGIRTGDIGGSAGTKEFAAAIIERIPAA